MSFLAKCHNLYAIGRQVKLFVLMNDGEGDFYLLPFAPCCTVCAWEADYKMEFSVQDVY